MKTFKKYITEANDFGTGDKIRVPHKGKMVQGKVVRYDKGDPHGSPFYVVDVGEYESIKVPAHKVEKSKITEEFKAGDLVKFTDAGKTLVRKIKVIKQEGGVEVAYLENYPSEVPTSKLKTHSSNEEVDIAQKKRVVIDMDEDASEDFERAKKELDNKKTEFKKKADSEKDRAKEQEFKEKQKESEQEFQEKQREDKQKREQKYKEQEDKKRDQERQQQAKKATTATTESIEDKFNREFLGE